MFIDGINFPNEIIEAIKNNNLVVFAGAGVSVDAPTSLPNFVDLTKKIAEGTGEVLKDDVCEIFLGYLKSKGIDVNRQAAELLSDTCLKYNRTHEMIVDLFDDPSKVKIVTTNYDHMFEQVIDHKELSVPIYNAPALPLGDDVEGIVHVHGNINNQKYMVLTDEDFGKAYLTEGYALRFLLKLFQSYTVLFIGYSYNDVILRYLTRAMDRTPEKTRFIMTSEKKSEWKTLGLVPVYFPNHGYDKMRDGLIKLGQRAKRGLLDWDIIIKEFKDKPPRDITLDSEIDYCLDSLERTRLLANNIHGREWLFKLNEKGIFKNLFLPEASLSDKDRIWMRWIVAKFIGKDDETFKSLYLSNEGKIHSQFVVLILRKLEIHDKNIQDIAYKEYIPMFASYIKSPWEIHQLIEVLSKRKLHYLCYKLFLKYYEVDFTIEKKIFIGKDELEYKHKFKGTLYEIERSWKSCKEILMASYSERILFFIKETILNLYDTYLLLNQGGNATELLSMTMLVIEDRMDYSKKDPLYLLCVIFCECCKALEAKSHEWIKGFLLQCLKSSSVLLKKVSLKALRESTVISSNDKFDMFINNSNISFYGGKEEVFLLIREIFNDLTEDRKNRLIDEIESLDTNASEYPIYNWCVWIKRFCSDNERINNLEKEILSRNNFRPREHPELDIEMGKAIWSSNKSFITQEQMVEIDPEKLIDLLNNYNEDPITGPNRWGMLNTFSECVKQDYNWTSKVVKIFTDGHVEKEDAWQRLLTGIQKSNFEIEQLLNLLNQFIGNINFVKDIHEVSELFLTTIKKDTMKEQFITKENELFDIINVLWNYRQEEYDSSCKLVDIALNTTLGNVLFSSICMLSYCDRVDGVPKRYKNFWEKNLKLEAEEKSIAICILVGHFNFLYLRDQEWCENNFSIILKGSEQQSFSAAWEGIAYFSRYLNKDVADVMAPIFLEAVEHLDWLKGEVRDGFIDLYVLLLIYVIDNPCLEYIPKFYRISEESDQVKFINGIGLRLRDMDDGEKSSLWNGWLKQYLIYRYDNKPVPLTEKEKELFISWLPELGQFFEEAVNIISEKPMPKYMDSFVLYRLDESKLVLQYPHSMISLLTKILDDGTEVEYCEEYFENIYKKAVGLSKREKEDFQEALLKRGITISFVSTE